MLLIITVDGPVSSLTCSPEETTTYELEVEQNKEHSDTLKIKLKKHNSWWAMQAYPRQKKV